MSHNYYINYEPFAKFVLHEIDRGEHLKYSDIIV